MSGCISRKEVDDDTSVPLYLIMSEKTRLNALKDALNDISVVC